jgi:prepilin-type N-terminal cleavage/methylation domain-containing protein
MKLARAFTLVEILIVVVLLAILAVIVLPSLSKGTTMAKESALASEIGMLRRFILIYASQHLEVAPGYPGGNTSAAPSGDTFRDQAMLSSNASGQTAAVGTPGFKYQALLVEDPPNPFNRKRTRLRCLANGEPLLPPPTVVHGGSANQTRDRPTTRAVARGKRTMTSDAMNRA